MKLTQKQIDLLSQTITGEGFEYAFMDYSNWKTIKDPKFHKLRKAYVEATNSLKNALTEAGVETEL